MTLPKINKAKLKVSLAFLILLTALIGIFRANYSISTANGFYGVADKEQIQKFEETRPYFEKLSTDKGRLEYSLEKSQESINKAKDILK